MTPITYVGPHTDGVEDVPGFPGAVLPGQTIEVPDDIAAGLLEQPDNWQPTKPTKPTPAKAEGGKQS